MITVAVYRGGRPVPGAHVIAIHKTGLWWSTAVTSPDGVAQLTTTPGSYFVVAGDDLGNGAWADDVGDGELVILNLVPKTNRRYYVELNFRVPVAGIVSRVLEALKAFYEKLVETLGELIRRLGMRVSATELARKVRLDEVREVDRYTLRVYFTVTGSPVKVGVILASVVRTILPLLAAVGLLILVARWAFGEELPGILKLFAYGMLVGGIAGLIAAVTGLIRELRRS
jgi:hypothetical protein